MTTPTTPEAIDRAVEAQRIMQNIAENSGRFSARYFKEYAISPEALRALLEAQPREWDAETIKDAPEGWYLSADAPFYDKEAAKQRLGRHPSAYTKFFGPIPHPDRAENGAQAQPSVDP